MKWNQTRSQKVEWLVIQYLFENILYCAAKSVSEL